MAIALIERLTPGELGNSEFLAEAGARSTRMSTRLVAEALLGVGLDVNAKWDGATLLHEIATNDARMDFADLALRHGADIQALNVDGMTPLHIAAMNSQPGMVWWLLAHGANPAATDSRRMSPLDVAHEQLIALPRNRRAVHSEYKWQEECLTGIVRQLLER